MTGRPRNLGLIAGMGTVLLGVFSKASRLALGSTLPPSQRVPELLLSVKGLGREPDHSTPSDAEGTSGAITLLPHTPS
jgi:hypothetical protein